MAKTNYVVVHWEEEKSYSTVALKKVNTGTCGLDEILNQQFPVKYGESSVIGRIVGIGRSHWVC